MKKLLLFALLLTPCAFAQDRRPHLAGTGSPLLQTPIPACTAGDIYVDTITGDTYTAKGYPCTWQLKGAGTVQGVSNDCTGSGSGTIPVTCTKTNGVSFAPSATTDATNAANISAGTIPDARFTAKTNCSDPTKVYSPAAGSCIAAGGTPSGANSVLQLANTLGTAFSSDSTISADTVNHNVIAPQLNGFTYAGPAQTGGGSNGIINSLGNSKTVIAEPTYNGETGLNWFNWNFSSANNYHLHRTLGGQDLDFFSNWVPASTFFSNTDNPAHAYFFMDTTSSATSKNIHSMGMNFNQYDTSPGYDAGATGLLDGGWKAATTLVINHNISGSGIAEGLSIVQNKSSEGDTANYMYNNTTGGWTALADEGAKALALQTNEVACAYRGTIAASGTGLTSLATTPTQLNGCQGVGKMVIDIGQGGGLDVAPYSGTITNTANVSIGANGLTDVTLSGTVPVSNAWGTINANINPAAGSTSASPYTVSATFNVTITSGTFDTTHVLCFGGGQHDCNIPTAVGTPSGGIVSITMPVRMSHFSGQPVMQGGLASSGLELPYFDYIAAGIKMRYLLDCIGSTTTTSARCTLWKQGTAQGFGNGFVPNDIFKSIPLTTLSNSGTTTVTATYTSVNLPHPERFNAATILISGASDSAFNTNCTNAVFTGASTVTCTIAGLSGTHTAATASAVPSGPQGTGINAYKIWPQARVLDVQDYAATPITSNGKMLVEPNNITFVSGDTLEVPNHESANFNGATIANNPLNPYIQVANGIQVSMQGAGVTGVANLLSLTNNNGAALYQGQGGYLLPPDMISTSGAYSTLINANQLPYGYGSSNAIINIASIPAAQAADTNLNSGVMFLKGNAGNYQLNFAPNTNTVQDISTGPHTFQASSFSFAGGVSVTSGNLGVTGGVVALGTAGGSSTLTANSFGSVIQSATNSAGSVNYTVNQLGSGASAQSFFSTQSDNNANLDAFMLQYSATHSTSGLTKPSMAYFGSGSSDSNGILLNTTAAAAPIVIGVNSVAQATFNGTNLTLATPTTTNSQITSTLATGTAPLIVASTTPVANLTLSTVAQLPAPFSIANVTVTLPTSAITANTCTGASTVTMTGLTTSMTFTTAFATDPSAVVGWGSSGGLNFVAWPTANTLNWRVCNATGSSITPGSMTLNVGAR